MRSEDFLIYETVIAPKLSPQHGCSHHFRVLREELITIKTLEDVITFGLKLSICLKCGFICLSKIGDKIGEKDGVSNFKSERKGK